MKGHYSQNISHCNVCSFEVRGNASISGAEITGVSDGELAPFLKKTMTYSKDKTISKIRS
jgi:hypothetical protein